MNTGQVMVLGGAIKVMETWDAKLERIVNDKEHKTRCHMQDMLMGEKFGLFCWGPCLLPYHILRGMNRIDMYFKGERPADHGYKSKMTILEYLF
jgi:hypothetical protein